MAYHPFLKKRFYLFIFRGRGREGEREKHVLRETLIGCLSPPRPPNWGPGLKPRHVPWLGIEPVTFCFAGQRSVSWATSARAWMAYHFLSFLPSWMHGAIFHSIECLHCFSWSIPRRWYLETPALEDERTDLDQERKAFECLYWRQILLYEANEVHALRSSTCPCLS